MRKDDCIEHSQKGNAHGYGMKQHEGRPRLAHRVAYCVAHGLRYSDIKGMVVRHRCDNPRCINPEHLELGTQQQNLDDMVSRGRSAKGMARANTVLTDEEVATIRGMYVPRHPEFGGAALAVRFGISRGHVSQLVNGGRRT